MALRPEVKALLESLIEAWVDEVLTEARSVQRRVIAAAVPAPPPAADPPRARTTGILHTREAAQYLGLSYSTLTKLRLAGGGPCYVKLGRRVGYRAEALEHWVAEREFPHTSAADHAKHRPTRKERTRRP